MSSAVHRSEKETVKLPGVASDGEFWISKVLRTIIGLEGDSKHVKPLFRLDGDEHKIRDRAVLVIGKVKVSCKIFGSQ